MKSVLEMALREDPNTLRIICFEPVNRGAIQTAQSRDSSKRVCVNP